MSAADIFWVFIFSATTSYLVGNAQNAKTALLEAKLNHLSRKTGVTLDMYEVLAPDIRSAIESGREILAIKLYRQATGCGLIEAKDAVGRLKRGEAPR